MEVRVKRTSIAAALALCVVGCQRTPDPTDAAERALERQDLGAVDVRWDRDARTAHLEGTVESTSERHRAEEIAESAVGTTGRVINDLAVQGRDDQAQGDLDGRIRSMLDRSMDKDPILKERRIDFAVVDGVVTVTGEVRSTAEKTKVSEIVRAAPGVKEMANALEINQGR
jgi:osmotically-inducible protein OsmY